MLGFELGRLLWEMHPTGREDAEAVSLKRGESAEVIFEKTTDTYLHPQLRATHRWLRSA